MTEQTSLWHYLGAFTGYTLAAIGVIYLAFWQLKKNPKLLAYLNNLQQMQNPQTRLNSSLLNSSGGASPEPNQAALLLTQLTQPQAIQAPAGDYNHSDTALVLESSLSLPDHQYVHVIRCGRERFLLSSSPKCIEILSPLKPSSIASNASKQGRPDISSNGDIPSITPISKEA